MTITACFSGPAANAPQAKNALAGAGFVVSNDDGSHGMQPCPEQEWTGERDASGNPIGGTGRWEPCQPAFPTAFTTASGDDLNVGVDAVRTFGFVLRSSWPTVVATVLVEPLGLEVPGPDWRSEIAALRAEIAAMKGGK